MVFFIRIHPPPPPLSHTHQHSPPIPPFSIKPSPSFPRRIHTNCRRWDSNAETFRTNKFDVGSIHDNDDFEDDDADQWLDVLEDFIDGVWIFKVFRSFGWMLPAVISSLLLTSGPKAFLMALALPLGQSALSLLFRMVWGRPKNKTKRRGKSKSKMKPPSPDPSRDEQEEEYVRGDRNKARATAYQTWVAGNDKETNGNGFGGWEELDRGAQFNMNKASGKGKTSKSKLSRRVNRSETPLLLRLLIAVFPFLGTWSRLL